MNTSPSSEFAGSVGSNGEIPQRSVRRTVVPQDGETGVQSIRHGYFHIRYLSARSEEAKTTGDTSQDYVVFQDDGERLVFAVCDGVSQSYFGNIAAQFLGDHLVDWLWRDFPWNSRGLDNAMLVDLLVTDLNKQTQEADALVQQQAIPADLPLMMQHALERKREYGSETVFACGSIELPGPRNPHGSVFLAWMGNTELQALTTREDDAVRNLIKATWDDRIRWSTKRGVVGGRPEIYSASAEGIGRIVAYTDGINSFAGKISNATDAELAQEVERLGAQPKSDDIAWLEIDLGPRWWRIPEKGLSIPNLVSIEMDAHKFRAEWNPVTDADHYLVDIRREGLDVDRKPTHVDIPVWDKELSDFEGQLEFVVQAVDKDGSFGPKARLKLLFPSPPSALKFAGIKGIPAWSGLNEIVPMAILAFVMAAAGLIVGLIIGVIAAYSFAATPTPRPADITEPVSAPAILPSATLEPVNPTVTSVPTSTSTPFPPTATPRPTPTPQPTATPTWTPVPTIEIIKPPPASTP
ncbi:hypothetical protein [Petrachloros mirabilis]